MKALSSYYKSKTYDRATDRYINGRNNVVSTFQRTDDEALWSYVNDMATELRTLKEKLEKNNEKYDNTYQSDDYFSFVTKLRAKMRANTKTNYYPIVHIDDMELGIDFKGLLYDRKTHRTLPRALAFDVYHRLYDHHLKQPFFK